MSQSERTLPARCVVDASVLVKLFLPEDGSGIATKLMHPVGEDGIVRAVPDLAYLECANIFWKWVRRGKLSPDLARENLVDLLALPLQVWPSRHLVEHALAAGIDKSVTVYDASYLALSGLLEVPLVTADQDLVRSAGNDHDVWLLDSLPDR